MNTSVELRFRKDFFCRSADQKIFQESVTFSFPQPFFSPGIMHDQSGELSREMKEIDRQDWQCFEDSLLFRIWLLFSFHLDLEFLFWFDFLLINTHTLSLCENIYFGGSHQKRKSNARFINPFPMNIVLTLPWMRKAKLRFLVHYVWARGTRRGVNYYTRRRWSGVTKKSSDTMENIPDSNQI